jgi:hypothetical protein
MYLNSLDETSFFSGSLYLFFLLIGVMATPTGLQVPDYDVPGLWLVPQDAET